MSLDSLTTLTLPMILIHSSIVFMIPTIYSTWTRKKTQILVQHLSWPRIDLSSIVMERWMSFHFLYYGLQVSFSVVPGKIFYSLISAVVIKLCRTSSSTVDFAESANLYKMYKNHFSDLVYIAKWPKIIRLY